MKKVNICLVLQRYTDIEGSLIKLKQAQNAGLKLNAPIRRIVME